jgi:hypothetical protein
MTTTKEIPDERLACEDISWCDVGGAGSQNRAIL